jgi:thiamine biosynthesis lipoprotein
MDKSLVMKWLALIGLIFFITSCSKTDSQLLHIQGQTMGTYYQVKYVLDAEQQGNKQLTAEAVKQEIDNRLEQVNNLMSTFRRDSELSRFNQAEKSLVVSDAMRNVVKSALMIFAQTDGAYDVTVGPLVNLWGFGPDKRPDKVPAQALIDEKMQVVGSRYLSLEGNRLTKSIPGLYLDLASIAKGYGVDFIAEYLQQLGISNYLVDIGGELRVQGNKPGKKRWTLAVERPVAGQNVQRLIHIGDNGIATSGDYRNYFEADGIRYSHTIDPKTGKPITHKLASVTVINKSCMLADGYATAITVLGPQAGLEFAQQHHLPVFMLVKAGNDFKEFYTPEFEPYLVKQE